MIDYSLKARCVKASQNMTAREVYEQVFKPEIEEDYPFDSFRRRLQEWKRKRLADDDTLLAGTYPGMTAHHATVQINKEGRITQAWIRQQQDTLDWFKVREIVCKGVPTSDIKPTVSGGDRMLEVPLLDMHFGIADFEYYKENLADLLEIVESKRWDEINIIVGQDVLHNNDLRGHTAKGTPIQKVDFVKAWADAQMFFRTLIDSALKQTARVRLHYSKGNHDECSGWCFFKALEAYYPQAKCDDSLAPRKCIFWKGCMIGFGHCEYTNKNSVLFQNFVLDFPVQFANATVREIHSGHLHRESLDEGMMVRRLPSACPTDDWSSDNGYVGAHKRFQIFEWAENRLKATHYL